MEPKPIDNKIILEKKPSITEKLPIDNKPIQSEKPIIEDKPITNFPVDPSLIIATDSSKEKPPIIESNPPIIGKKIFFVYYLFRFILNSHSLFPLLKIFF